MNLGVETSIVNPTRIGRKIPTFAGSQYGTLSSVVSMVSGDTVDVAFATTTAATSMFLFGHSATPASVEFDTGNLLQLVGGTVTIDGVSVADGASITAYQDGKIHTLVFTATGSLSVGYIGQSGAGAGFFNGQILSTKFTDKSGANDVVTNYVFDSGSTLYQLPRGEVLGANLYTGTTVGDWLEPRSASTLSFVDSVIRSTADSTATHGMVTEITGLVVGESLSVECNVSRGTNAGQILVRLSDVSTLSGGTLQTFNNPTDGTVTVTTTVTATTMYFGGISTGHGAGEYFELSGISLQKIPKACTLTNFSSTDWEAFLYSQNPNKWTAVDGSPILEIA